MTCGYKLPFECLSTSGGSTAAQSGGSMVGATRSSIP